MTLKKAQKMYLVTPQQIKRLSQTATSDASIRESAEEDLDEKMRAILNDPGMNSYEKIKRYGALLQRYLSFTKQDQKDQRRVTLTLQRTQDPQGPLDPPGPVNGGQAHDQDQSRPTDGEGGDIGTEILKSLPPRDRKNAEYIINKLSQSSTIGGWNSKGEFIYRGDVVRGSHMIDLFKRLSLPYKKLRASPPMGWSKFLNTLSELNIPLSSVSNPHARDQYRELKLDYAGASGSLIQDPPPSRSADGKQKIFTPPRWITVQELEQEQILDGRDRGRGSKGNRARKKQFPLSPRWISP